MYTYVFVLKNKDFHTLHYIPFFYLQTVAAVWYKNLQIQIYGTVILMWNLTPIKIFWKFGRIGNSGPLPFWLAFQQ